MGLASAEQRPARRHAKICGFIKTALRVLRGLPHPLVMPKSSWGGCLLDSPLQVQAACKPTGPGLTS